MILLPCPTQAVDIRVLREARISTWLSKTKTITEVDSILHGVTVAVEEGRLSDRSAERLSTFARQVIEFNHKVSPR